MKTDSPDLLQKNRNYGVQRTLFVITGILLNVVPAYLADRFEIHLFLDTAGTILTGSVAGPFPGVLTAVISNVLCMTFNESALFFTFINAAIAIYSSWYARKSDLNKPVRLLIFVLSTAAISGILSSFAQWIVFGHPQNSVIEEMSGAFSQASGMGVFYSFFLVNLLLNIVDKGMSVALSVILAILMPKNLDDKIRAAGWRQRPLSDAGIRSLRKWRRDVRFSMTTRSTFTLVIMILLSVIVMGFVGIRFYFENEKKEMTQDAGNTAAFAASVVDADMIDEYLRNGKEAPGYRQTEDLLYRIRDNEQGVKRLYVLKIENYGCRVVFDLASEGASVRKPGDVIDIDDTIKPNLLDMLEGKEIEPVESKEGSDRVVTVYHPIRNKDGETKGYAGTDVSLDNLAGQTTLFVIKALMILAGFFILILVFELWITGTFTVFPIASIASCVDDFSEAGDDQKKLDENVRNIRALDIKTGDELEKLYHTICGMALSQAEQVRSLKYFADTTAKMQDGLIITMANMVENRDSDTGAHIQKTAAYVKVIVEGLKQKGYYPQKITPKFMSDVVRSAPLHDVGKINIPDEVLNKPGKLTDEEYEIMKTHTTAGKKILENAISTTQGENYLKEARNMAAYHHERWDGKGYPEGLHGEVIPLSARIMAVADVFDALTSPRVYKPAFPLEKALSIISEGAGAQFDPKCVEVFMENLTEVKIILKKYNEQ